MAITVKIVRVPGAVTELALDDGATVGDAFSAANLTPGLGESTQLDGRAADTSTPLYDGARIVVAKAAKGA